MAISQGDRIEIRRFAGAVARRLGSAYQLESKSEAQAMHNDWCAMVLGPNGARIFFSNTWGPKGKIQISGRYPDHSAHLRNGGVTDKINVSPGLGPDHAAAEIERRLLPVYLPRLDDANREVVHQNEERARQLAARVRLISHGGREYHHRHGDVGFYIDKIAGEANVSGCVHTGGSEVELELRSLTVDQAELVIETLRRGHLPLWNR